MIGGPGGSQAGRERAGGRAGEEAIWLGPLEEEKVEVRPDEEARWQRQAVCPET